ncbi:MAG TPA: twin-arginine translocase TatA/TatE family subunit [Fimbriimonadaceae bacterium]|nr:twin-arginine translocase TatA/TatE family subunit [Fimbriimonadaceae bacterium]
MGALQPIHLIIILAIVLVLFGGSKIPQLMKGIGQGTGEFKKGLEESRRSSETEDKKEDKEEEKDAAKK